jgi:hypothetical protein
MSSAQTLTIHNTGQDYVKAMTCEADYCVGSGDKALHYVDCGEVRLRRRPVTARPGVSPPPPRALRSPRLWELLTTLASLLKRHWVGGLTGVVVQRVVRGAGDSSAIEFGPSLGPTWKLGGEAASSASSKPLSSICGLSCPY